MEIQIVVTEVDGLLYPLFFSSYLLIKLTSPKYDERGERDLFSFNDMFQERFSQDTMGIEN